MAAKRVGLGMRWLSFSAVAVLVTGVVSTAGVTAVPTPAFATSTTGNEAPVPSQPLGTPSSLPAEASQPALPTPVWPAASNVTVTLPAATASAQVPGHASASASTPTPAADLVSAGSVVSVGAVAASASGSSMSSTDSATDPSAVSPSSVNVQVVAQAAVAPAGGRGLGIVVDRADGVASAGPVEVSVDYSKFAYAFGSDYAGRLRLVSLPACALTTPTASGCDTPTFAQDAVNDTAAHTITATVDANPDPAASAGQASANGTDAVAGGSVMTLEAADSSDGGDFRASTMSATGSWSVSPGSGSFDYSVPITAPPPAEGSAPDLSLSYDSQSVDGLTSAKNTQASTTGLGWSLTSAYIERSYRLCPDDGQGTIEEDLCWYSPYAGTDPGHESDSVYSIMLNGVSSSLVPDATTAGRYHPVDDPGWYVQHHVGGSGPDNSDDSAEWWQVFAPDGSTYDFGYGNDKKTGAADNSVLTEPVFGNDSGEPCHGSWSSTEDDRSPCTQAWRWMLDTTIDANEVVTSYHYTKETNSFDSVLGPNVARQYDMNANLTEIDYGWAEQLAGTNYTDKVVLDYDGRCATRMYDDPIRVASSVCPQLFAGDGQGADATAAKDYPDVPADKLCFGTWTDSDHHCGGTSYAPTFFSTQMLWSIKTYTLTTTGTATEVMYYQMRHGLVNPSGSVTDFLWLDYIQREGFSGTGGSVYLPVINFNGTDLQNEVGTSVTGTNHDTVTGESTDLRFRRITSVYNDLGGIITVSYGLPDYCTTGSPPAPASNTKDCYRQQWTTDGGTAKTNWFNKWLVLEVDENPNVGTGDNGDGDPTRTTTYDYSGGAAGWRFPANPLQQRADESWTEWRGYSYVTVTQGGGPDKHSTGYWMYQGLDGDRKVIAPSGSGDYKNVPVSGSTAAAAPTLSLPDGNTDDAWLADKVFEQSTRDDQGNSHQYVVNSYGFADDVAKYDGLPDARMVRQTATNTWDFVHNSTLSSNASWRHAEQQSFYDSTASTDFGQPSMVEDDGQVGVSDNTCTTYGYAYNVDPANGRWIGLQDEVHHYPDTTCANHGNVAANGYTATLYDTATSVGTDVPTDGNPIEVDTYTSASTFTSVEHSYDAGGRPLSTTDGDGNKTVTSYNPAAGWPTAGVVTTTPIPDITVDDFHGPTGSTTPLSSTVVSSPATGQITKTTDANGNVTTVQYDSAGRTLNVWKPKDPTSGNATLKYTYAIPVHTSSGVPDSVNGPASSETSTLQSGSTYISSFTYLDGLGQVREQQAPAANGDGTRDVVSIRYDTSGYTEGTSAPYDSAGAPGSGMVNPLVSDLPSYTDLIVNWAGDTIESKILSANTKIAAGDVLTTSFPDQTTTTDPNGNITTTKLDVFGDTTDIVQNTPNLSPASVTTHYDYDDEHRLIKTTDAKGENTAYTLNWAGQQTAAVDPDAGDSCTYYDGAGNTQYTAQMTPPAAGTPLSCPGVGTTIANRLTTVYDAVGRPTSTWLGAAGSGTALTSTTYDTAPGGRSQPATSTSYNAGDAYTEAVDGYDPNGNSLGTTITLPASAGFGTTPFDTTATYDSAGHELTVGYPAVGTGTAALPAETATSTFNANGAPVSLSSGLGTYVTGTTFNNWGPLNTRTYAAPGSSLTAQRSYGWDKATGWLTNIKTDISNLSGDAQDDTYGYDKTGNVTEIASAAGTAQQQCFTYDDLNRLSAADTTTASTIPATAVASCDGAANHTGGTAPYDLGYQYDTTGNITSVIDKIAGTTATYAYPNLNSSDPSYPVGPHAVATVTHKTTATGATLGTDTYNYDPNHDGNTTSRSINGVTSTLTWTPQQQLASISGGGHTTNYIYDAAGNLLLRTGPSGTTLYLPGQELNLGGTVVTPTRYYNLGSATIAMRVGGTTTNGTLTWLTADGQGSSQLAINTTTGTYTQQRYLPFGAQRGSQGPTTGTQNGFLGQAYDPATGLIQDGARFYDPTLARFISPDPLLVPGSPQDLNAYSYSYNNPETNSDPSGLLVLQEGGTAACPSGDPKHCDHYGHAGNKDHNDAPIGGKYTCDNACQRLANAANAARAKAAAAAKAAAKKAAAEAKAASIAYFDQVRHNDIAYYCGPTPGARCAGEVTTAFYAQYDPQALDRLMNSFAGQVVTQVGLFVVLGGLGGLANPAEDAMILGVDAAGDDIGILGADEGGNLAADDGGNLGPDDGGGPEGCPLNSFSPNTSVLMAGGVRKEIANIEVGDRVISTNPVTGTTTAETVTRLHDNRDTQLTDVLLNTDNGFAVVHTTKEHLFWNKTAKSWMPASALTTGTELRTAAARGGAVVLGVRSWNSPRDMRNLTVNQFHTYYVLAGNTPILVHNCPRATGKGRASDLPSWMNPDDVRRLPNESPSQAADRVMRQRFPDGNFPKGPGTEYNKALKFASRNAPLGR